MCYFFLWVFIRARRRRKNHKENENCAWLFEFRMWVCICKRIHGWSQSILLQCIYRDWEKEKNELANNHKKRQTNERRKKRAETRTHWTVQAVIYLISPAHIHCSLTLHHHLFHYCIARAICMLRFLFAMRNGIRSKSIFRCSFHSSAVSNSNFEIFFFSLFSCVCAWAFEPLPLSHSFVHLLYVYALKKSFFFCSSFTVFLSVSLSLHSI